MPNVYQYTAVWTGFQGAPGYTKFHYMNRDSQSLVDAGGNQMRTFFVALQNYLSTGWSIQVQQTVPFFDMVTGRMVGETSQTAAPAAVAGLSSTSAWAGGVGAMIAWGTNVIWNGHRVHGRTFLVPLRGASDVDGTILPAAISAIQSAGSALITSAAGDFVIWSRQFSPPPESQQINGTTGSIISGIVRDKSGILRSRRD